MKTIEDGAVGYLVTKTAGSAGGSPSKGGCKPPDLEADIRPPSGFVNISAEMRMDSQHAPPLNRPERGRSRKCARSRRETNHGNILAD